MKSLPYKISTLVYLRDTRGRVLLMKRAQAPNLGTWSPIGGKLEMSTGESPYEAAVREVREEIGLTITHADLHLFSMIAEKGYENSSHWLMFLFDCRRLITDQPPPISEGSFAFFPESEIMNLEIPETDRMALWPVYFNNRQDFTSLKADCHTPEQIETHVEEQMLCSNC